MIEFTQQEIEFINHNIYYRAFYAERIWIAFDPQEIHYGNPDTDELYKVECTCDMCGETIFEGNKLYAIENVLPDIKEHIIDFHSNIIPEYAEELAETAHEWWSELDDGAQAEIIEETYKERRK